MRNMMLLVLNMLKIIFRKNGNIFIYLFLPLGGVLLSMAMYSGAGSAILRVGISDQDGSVLSKDFYKTLTSSEGYRVSAVEEKDIKDKLIDQKLDAAIIVPEGYSESIYSKEALKMRIVSLKGQDTTVWLENYINMYTRNLSDLSTASNGDRTAFGKMYSDYRENPLKLTNVKLKDEKTAKMMTVQSLGFLIMFLMLGAGFTSQFILNEKRSRTFYRICSAPVTARSYVAANTITSILVVCAQSVLILLAMKYLFRMETYVPDPVLFLILVTFGFAAIGLSLLTTAFSGSSYMAGTLNTLITTPTCMIGGCYWPVYFMPDFMQKLSYFVPQRWALDAVQKMQSGENILMNIVILLAFAVALFTIAAYKFSRTSSIQKFV